MDGAGKLLHVDLCAGLGGWSEPFKESDSWRSVGLDVRDDLKADLVADVRCLPLECEPELVTASPPCTEFTRWMLPWLDEPEPSLELVLASVEAVKELSPQWWVLENSRGLHQYWRKARTRVGPYHLWGEFPPIDADPGPGKMAVSGTRPEERAKIPYALADAVRRSVEVFGGHV